MLDLINRKPDAFDLAADIRNTLYQAQMFRDFAVNSDISSRDDHERLIAAIIALSDSLTMLSVKADFVAEPDLWEKQQEPQTEERSKHIEAIMNDLQYLVSISQERKGGDHE